MNGNIFDAGQHNRLYLFWPKEDVTDSIRKRLCNLRKKNPRVFLDQVCSVTYGRAHVGFKIFEGENDAILDQILADTNIRKIVLFRRNILASFSSALVARETGRYGQRDGKRHPDPPKVKFSRKQFANFHDRYVTFFHKVMEELRKSGQFYFLVNYEDINEPDVLANIVAFVGGDPIKPFSRELQYKTQVKQNSSNIVSRFSNPRTVKKFLAKFGLLYWTHESELNMGRRLSPDEIDEDGGELEPVDEAHADNMDKTGAVG